MGIQKTPEFQGKKFIDINKGDLDIDMTDAEKQKENVTKTEYADVLKWMKTTLGKNKVSDVKLSNRLTDSMAVIVQASWGMTPTMQRYMRATASQRPEMDMASMNQAILEINPDHPVIEKLKKAYLAYEMASLIGGYTVEDMGTFAKRVSTLIAD